jgi:hypothetical protein
MFISRIVPFSVLIQQSLQTETKPSILSQGDPQYELEKNMIVCGWLHELAIPLSMAIELTSESVGIIAIRKHAKFLDIRVSELNAYVGCLASPLAQRRDSLSSLSIGTTARGSG